MTIHLVWIRLPPQKWCQAPSLPKYCTEACQGQVLGRERVPPTIYVSASASDMFDSFVSTEFSVPLEWFFCPFFIFSFKYCQTICACLRPLWFPAFPPGSTGMLEPWRPCSFISCPRFSPSGPLLSLASFATFSSIAIVLTDGSTWGTCLSTSIVWNGTSVTLTFQPMSPSYCR